MKEEQIEKNIRKYDIKLINKAYKQQTVKKAMIIMKWVGKKKLINKNDKTKRKLDIELGHDGRIIIQEKCN